MMMPPCSQPLGEREDLTETMPPVALRSLVDSGSRQDDQFGRMVRTTARRPARCGKPDPFRAQGKPRHWARVVAGVPGPPPFVGGGARARGLHAPPARRLTMLRLPLARTTRRV